MKKFKIKRDAAKKGVHRYDVTCVCGCDHVTAIGVGDVFQVHIDMDACKCPNPEAVQHGPMIKAEVMH